MTERESLVASPAGIPPRVLPSFEPLEAALGSAIRGKPEVIRFSLVCLLARGHLLIEDVPGVGKTTLAQALARSIACRFHRLQFTSDMLPSDVLGVTIYNLQSALLEAMNESQVTIDGRPHSLPRPFMVIATQNPVEHHGTYPLPESQLDRFFMRLRIGYPDTASEREIVRQSGGALPEAGPSGLVAEDILRLQDAAQGVLVEDAVVDYILAIVEQTRHHESLALGVSPRGAQALYRAAQALALLEGRDYSTPDDAKRLAVPVFAHRVVINTRNTLVERRLDAGERIIEQILTQVEVPL